MFQVTAGGDDTPYAADKAKICVPLGTEMSDGKSAGTVAIDRRMA